MYLFYILSIIVFLLWIISFIKGIREVNKETHIKAVSNTQYNPKISIIIPARDEEKRLPNLLNSIAKQNYQNYEVVVVDDNSSDNTGQVASSFKERISNLRVIRPEIRTGWCGKNLALVEGFNKASPDSEWLLFIDADCELKDGALSTIVETVRSKDIDCLSLFPEVKSEHFFERLLLPSVGAMVTLFNSPEKVNDPDSDISFLNGQFIFIKRDVYKSIGTHEVVKDAILEDAALAYEIKRRGFKIFLGFGREIFSIRMYETFSDFINGWTKNLFLILKSRVTNLIKMIFITILLSYLPIIWLIYGLIKFPQTESCVFIGGYFFVLSLQMYIRYISKTYPLYAILAPLSSTIVSFIAIRSAIRHITNRGVDWKGRRYFSKR